MIVDVHNHYYPPRYMEELARGRSSVTVTVGDDGDPRLHYPGDYNIAVRGHRDIEYREQVLEAEGVELQVLSLTTPGTHVEVPVRAVELAREGGLDFDLLERQFRRPVGCAKCKGIGYRGQTLIAEVLEMSDEIGQALRKGDLAKQLRTIAVGQGMTTMGADGVRRAAAGQTTIDEMLRALAV